MDVRWTDPAVQARYEDMVSVLISRIHPDAQRIDGSGGDGGRDVQVPTTDGLLIYELKSFTDRISGRGRKQQIARSLSRAAEHNPYGWRLVVPIDHTPAELEWFERTTSAYPFPCDWFGKTWLDSELAARPDIPRYFLEGTESEVLRLLQELREEDGKVGNALVAARRARDITGRLNDLDPYYSYALGIGVGPSAGAPGSVLSVQSAMDRIDVIPKFATALRDRPITANLEVAFDDASSELREEFERSLDYGDPVELPPSVVRRLTIDAPGGLSKEFENAFVKLGSTQEELEDPAIVHLGIMAPDGDTQLAVLEFTMRQRRAGRRGAVLSGSDASGLLNLELRLSPDDRVNLHISYSFVPLLPSAGLPAARWMEMVRPPNLLDLEFVTPVQSRSQVPIENPLAEAGISKLFEAFKAVQDRCGLPFQIPDGLEAEEWEAVSKAEGWLSPEKVRFTWNELTLGMSEVPSVILEGLNSPDGSALMMTFEEVVLEFRERRLRLGPLARTIESAVVANVEEAQAAAATGSELTLKLVPGHSNVGYEWLTRPGEPMHPDEIHR